MEGYSGEDSAESKDDGKEKKANKAAGLGGRTFEFAKKTGAAEKIADSSSIWEKLIPKDGEKPAEKAPDESILESFKVEKADDASEASAEEVEDPSVETLSDSEKAEVAKDYAQEKVAELEAGRNDAEDPAEAAAREANIEYLHQVEQDAEAVPAEPVEAAPEIAITETDTPDNEVTEDLPAQDTPEDMPAEFAHDEAIDLNAPEITNPTDEAEPFVQPVAMAPPTTPPTPPSPATAAFGMPNFNTAPQPVAIPEADLLAQARAERANDAAFFFAGGILGYLLGRRRGRIKTEKRMRAVTKKLEAQISETRDRIAQQEVVIRQQARDNYSALHQRGAEITAAHAMETKRPETITEHTEHDASRRGTPERPSISTAEAAQIERVQHMDHRELLAIAEKVTIDGTSLRKIYEAKQITEPGLRRLTREYLRGGNLKAVLKQELAVKEMQYERDPQMRDRLAASYAGVDAAQPQTASQGMADLLAQHTSPSTARMHENVQQAADEAEQAKKSHAKQLLITAWGVLIFVLVAVAIILAAR